MTIKELYKQTRSLYTTDQNKIKNVMKTYLYEPCSVKRGLNASAKSIEQCQPAQSAQADMDRNFSLSLNFLHVKG